MLFGCSCNSVFLPICITKPDADTTVANESRPNFVICINFCPDLISPAFRQNPRFFFWEETKESSVEIASLSYSAAFSFCC